MSTVQVDIEHRYENVSVKFAHEARRFCVHYGYKQRNDAQIRLEPKDMVYLSSHVEERYPNKLISAAVPFAVFVRELPEFIKHLEAQAAKEAKDD